MSGCFPRFKVALLILFFTNAVAVFANPAPVVLGDETVTFNGTQEFDWAEGLDNSEDPTSIEDIRWTRTKKAPGVRSGKVPVWYRFTLVNGLDHAQQFAFHTMGANPSEYVWLHVIRGNGQKSVTLTGGAVPYIKRPVFSMLLVLPFDLDPGERVVVYLGSQSTYSRGLHYQIRTHKSWRAFEVRVMQFEAFYFGMLFVALMINVLAFVALRSPGILAYCLFIASSILINIIGSGYLNYLAPETYAPPSALLLVIMLCVHVGVMSYFVTEFLGMARWNPRGNRAMLALMWCGFLTATANAFGYNGAVTVAIFDWIVNIGTVLIFWYGAKAFRQSHSPYAWSFLVGFGVYTLSGLIWNMQYRSVIPSTGWTRYSLFFGQIIENMVFTYAVMREARKQLSKLSDAEARENYGRRMGMFAKILTHDLSNYIAIVEGNLRFLGRPDITEAQKRSFSDKALMGIGHQKDVLKSVKDLIALEDGKADLDLAPVDLRSLLPELKVAFEQRLTEKGVSLDIHLAGQGSILVMADRATLFHSVLSNLVSNAIKFSESGGRVRIDVARTSDDVYVEVIDSGVGMPEELTRKIFSDHEKTSRVGTAGEKGTGFGLPIAKAYMDLYGGQISVKSKPAETHPGDHGTTFKLRFNRAAKVK